MADQLLASLQSMGQLLLAMDTGVGLLIGVGLSMSASHLFALLANRLTPKQIVLHMIVDALVLSLAFLLGILCHSLMLMLLEGVPLQPITFANHMGAAITISITISITITIPHPSLSPPSTPDSFFLLCPLDIFLCFSHIFSHFQRRFPSCRAAAFSRRRRAFDTAIFLGLVHGHWR